MNVPGILLDALLDTLKLAPIILAANVLIELLESRLAGRVALSRSLRSPVAPLIGAGLGIVPQCGFSVVAAGLYSERRIGIGTMLAVFVATGDEAVPVLLSDPNAAVKLFPLLPLQFAFAVVVGYVAYLIARFSHKKAHQCPEKAHAGTVSEPHVHADGDHGDCQGSRQGDNCEAAHDEAGVSGAEGAAAECVHGCHGHTVAGGKVSAGEFVLHILRHTLTVLAFVLAVNVAAGFAVAAVGEDRLLAFLSGARYAQPFVAALVGLIPNCAASVVIARLYALGGLTLGSALAGLAAGAGLGYTVLFRRNRRHLAFNIAVLAAMYAACSVFGLLVDLIM